MEATLQIQAKFPSHYTVLFNVYIPFWLRRLLQINNNYASFTAISCKIDRNQAQAYNEVKIMRMVQEQFTANTQSHGKQ